MEIRGYSVRNWKVKKSGLCCSLNSKRVHFSPHISCGLTTAWNPQNTAHFPSRKSWNRQSSLREMRRPRNPMVSGQRYIARLIQSSLELLGKPIRSRLTEAIHAVEDLFWTQFGLRAGKSTLDAAMKVMDSVNRGQVHSYRSRRVLLFVRLDVRNVFYSVR